MAGTEVCGILPVGFVQKKIKYRIILTAEGRFETAVPIPDEEQDSMIPSTPQAEGRTGENGPPFPMADQLKYLAGGQRDDGKFQAYLDQLTGWAQSSGAPDCLRVLVRYLEGRSLMEDLLGVPGLKLRLHKKEEAQDWTGPDAKSMACFSIHRPTGEDVEERLWMRADVRESWSRYQAGQSGGELGLCYATGQWLPILQNHPKVSGYAKLISAKDAGFPFQYKGRFIADRSAAEVSTLASGKAHSALRWLLEHQGFQRYGMSVVAWNTAVPSLDLPEEEKDDLKPNTVEKRPLPDTFEVYADALRDAAAGHMERLRLWSEAGHRDEDLRRAEEIVILGLQAATDGRMSITYYQELPGDLYVEQLDRWADDCRWEMPGRMKRFRSPTWREISEAVLGRDAVSTAKLDLRCAKAATKQMRELQMRLLSCVVDGRPLPEDMVQRAFQRAVQPQSFKDRKDQTSTWDSFAWQQCVSVTCAMIRRRAAQQGGPIPSPVLDPACRDRDYLFGRLLAVAHKLELDAADPGEKDKRTEAVRMMGWYVRSPGDGWLRLYGKLLPAFKRLGRDRKTGMDDRKARWYQGLLGQIERLFRPGDREGSRPLSYGALVGFSAQLRELFLPLDAERQAAPELPPFVPPQERDALYGCLLAAADDCEWDAESWDLAGRRVSRRDGRTNAMRLMNAYIASPAVTWMHLHDKLIPYLEKQEVRAAERVKARLSRIEQAFRTEERSDPAPLGPLFLHGYLGMRQALMTPGGLDETQWRPLEEPYGPIVSRDAAFGALLALEDRVERWVLDQEKKPEEERSSNAMRFLARAAQRPDEVMRYLLQRMRPYQRRHRFPDHIEREREALEALIAQNRWDTDRPLGPLYLHMFYRCIRMF